MRKTACLLMGLIWMTSCGDDYVPAGLYNYQVERLLSQGSSKEWTLVSRSIGGSQVALDDCTDSLKLVVDLKSGLLVFNEYTPRVGCALYDTLYYGSGLASGELLFTDSIVLEGGAYTYLLIDEITSKRLSFRKPNQESLQMVY